MQIIIKFLLIGHFVTKTSIISEPGPTGLHNYFWLTLRAAITQYMCATANRLLVSASWLLHYVFLYPPQQKGRNQLPAYGSISALLHSLRRGGWDDGSVICNHVSEEIHIFEQG